MEWFALLIPLLAAAGLKLFGGRKVVWWEVALPMAPALVIVPLVGATAAWGRMHDVERWGGWVTKVTYFEDWDEWIHRTCTRSYPCGSDGKGHTRTCTETYDCSYRKYHPEEWHAYGSNGEDVEITQSFYDTLVARFGGRKRFVDLDRHYYRKDGDSYVTTWPGDSYVTTWPGDDPSFTPLFTEHSFTNQVKGSPSVFHFDPVEHPERLGLYEYPAFRSHFDDPAALGAMPEADRRLQRHNARLGAKKEVRLWLLVFKDGQPRQAGLDQERHWQGGKKNEVVCCVGLNPRWCHTFCWSPDGDASNDEMKVALRNYVEVEHAKDLDQARLADFLAAQADKRFRRKPFEEFNYLKPETPAWAVWTIYVLTTLSTAGVCWFALVNDVDEGSPEELWSPWKPRTRVRWGRQPERRK